MITDNWKSLRSLIEVPRPASSRDQVRDASSFSSFTEKTPLDMLYPIDDGKPKPVSDDQLSGLPFAPVDDLSEVPERPGDNVDPMVLLTQKLSARMLEMLQTPVPSGLPYERS